MELRSGLFPLWNQRTRFPNSCSFKIKVATISEEIFDEHIENSRGRLYRLQSPEGGFVDILIPKGTPIAEAQQVKNTTRIAPGSTKFKLKIVDVTNREKTEDELPLLREVTERIPQGQYNKIDLYLDVTPSNTLRVRGELWNDNKNVARKSFTFKEVNKGILNEQAVRFYHQQATELLP